MWYALQKILHFAKVFFIKRNALAPLKSQGLISISSVDDWSTMGFRGLLANNHWKLRNENNNKVTS
jgi:hypothetical protein